MKMIQTFQEKIEMIAQLTAGNKVKFQYVDRSRDYATFPVNTQYEISDYEGTVLEVRDTEIQRLGIETVRRKPEIERSRFLMVVQLPDNKIKSFYDGRVINVQKINKNFLRRTLDKLTGK
jgi:hypothetical protein